jgi:Transcriptional regulator, AbiEi antitoxin
MADQFLECQRDLLRLQRGVITRRQALAAGLAEKAIVVRLQSGHWQRLQTGVYAVSSGEPPRPAILWAAVLRAGHGAPRGARQRAVSRSGAHQYQDVSYDGYLVVVERHGLAAHPPEARWRDMRRDSTNTAEGVATLRLG